MSTRPVPPPPPESSQPAQPDTAAPQPQPPQFVSAYPSQPPAPHYPGATPAQGAVSSGADGGFATDVYYAPGWTQAQMAPALPPPTPREPRERKPGRTLMWVLLGAGAVALIAVAVWFMASPATWYSLTGATSQLPADVASPQSANSRQLSAGNCIATADNLSDLDAGIRVVPCADPHEAQVISAFEFSAESDWSGAKEAQRRVTRSCSLSSSEIEAGYSLLALAPSADSWKQGDRTGLCVAVAPEQVTSSLL